MREELITPSGSLVAFMHDNVLVSEGKASWSKSTLGA